MDGVCSSDGVLRVLTETFFVGKCGQPKFFEQASRSLSSFRGLIAGLQKATNKNSPVAKIQNPRARKKFAQTSCPG